MQAPRKKLFNVIAGKVSDDTAHPQASNRHPHSQPSGKELGRTWRGRLMGPSSRAPLTSESL